MSEETAALDRVDAARNATLGERVGHDAVRFVRTFSAPVERVWQALTTPGDLAVWLGRPIAIELVAAGRFEVALTGDDCMDGRILELEPNRRLVIEWHETSNGLSSPYGTRPGDTSVVSFDLAATPDGGTELTFMHRYIVGGPPMIGFGAGWHAIFEALEALLAEAPQPDREHRYELLEPAYQRSFATIAARGRSAST